MASKEHQLGFGDYEGSFVKKQTRRERFLAEMEKVVPFSELLSMIEPFYPRVGPQGGRPPYRLEVMLRIHLMQNRNSLSGEAMENELVDIPCIRRFAEIDLVTEDIPDAITILAFRHFLEKHHLGEKIFQVVVEHLSRKGLLLREGSVVDATVIHAPTSTKNRKKERDPEMHQTRKGNQWFFGMKAHIGVDKDSGLIHSVATTGANVHDGSMAAELLHGEEKVVYGDAGYQGLHKREEMAGRDVECRIAMRAGQRRRLRRQAPEGQLLHWAEKAKEPLGNPFPAQSWLFKSLAVREVRVFRESALKVSRLSLGSGLITRRGQWWPGGWQNGRRGRSRRSGLQGAASPSVGKKESRLCDPCDPTSCCSGLVSCGSNGAGCKAGCPAGTASYGFCPCHPLDPPSPLPQAAVLAQHISTGEVTPLPLTQVESQGTTFTATDPMELAGHAPPWCHQSGGGYPPLLGLDAVGWALKSVVSIISTSGSRASGGSAESGGSGAST